VKSGSSYREKTPVEKPMERRFVVGWKDVAVTFALGWRKKCFERIRQRRSSEVSDEGEGASSAGRKVHLNNAPSRLMV
jgi:hypothetical protein